MDDVSMLCRNSIGLQAQLLYFLLVNESQKRLLSERMYKQAVVVFSFVSPWKAEVLKDVKDITGKKTRRTRLCD